MSIYLATRDAEETKGDILLERAALWLWTQTIVLSLICLSGSHLCTLSHSSVLGRKRNYSCFRMWRLDVESDNCRTAGLIEKVRIFFSNHEP